MCTCRALFWLKAFHAFKLIPVCVRLSLEQDEQLKTLGFWELGDGPGCEVNCTGTFKCVARLKALLQTGHTWQRSLELAFGNIWLHPL
uniref:Uncharacterized protein n=1 Tax=Periophthalmus magnuspinnatus TaxID=409849 RepID=A0A3B4AUS1_9GOBI